MSTPKVNPNMPEFSTVSEIKRDIDAVENNEAVMTPEWLTRALMTAWQEGHSAGDVSAYYGGLHKQRNPFMTEREQQAWYES